MRGIVKQYPLVRAIDGADFTVEQGEIHSLLGENGAGKSTLMKILYGMTTPTAGEGRVFGKPVAITRPAQAIALGIGMVHQHFMLTPVMTVAENVVIGSEPVRGLSLTERGVPILRDVCLSLRKGEILGIAGIEGNGQTELIEVLTGLRRPDHMELFKDGKPLSGNAAAFLAAGVGHVPEDRMTRGLVLEMSIEDNLILGYHRRPAFARRGLRLASAIRRFAEQERTEFAIKAPNVQERCSALSGGNQQKVVIARVFSENPDVIIVAQPTRGVDVGAMEYIHHRLLDLRDGGKSILLISADLDEVRSLSDRLAVIYGGRIVAEGKPDTWSDMEIGLLMTGGSLAPEKEGTA